MIVCDNFIFLHLHKSGGTFVSRLMMTCISSARRIGYHLPYSEIPETCKSLPILGTVRNPWSYYVSWYHFQNAQERPNLLFLLCSDNRRNSFEATITSLVMLENNEAHIEKLAAAFPDTYVNYGLNLTKSCIQKIHCSGKGFYTFLHDRLYAGAHNPRIIKMETLRDSLRILPDGLGPHEVHRARQFIAGMPNLNVSEHGPDQTSADAFAQAAERVGFLTTVSEVEREEDPWDVTATKNMIPTSKNITDAEEGLSALAQAHQGRADGWGFFDV